MLVQIENSFFISRIITDRFSFYLYSTPEKVPNFNEVMKKLDIKKNETAYIFSLVDTYKGMTIEKAYEILLIEKGVIETNVNPFAEFNEINEEDSEDIEKMLKKLTLWEKIKKILLLKSKD